MRPTSRTHQIGTILQSPVFGLNCVIALFQAKTCPRSSLNSSTSPPSHWDAKSLFCNARLLSSPFLAQAAESVDRCPWPSRLRPTFFAAGNSPGVVMNTPCVCSVGVPMEPHFSHGASILFWRTGPQFPPRGEVPSTFSLPSRKMLLAFGP